MQITSKKKPHQSGFDIPEYQLESLARVLLPLFREYLSSEQGQKDYAEWQQLQQQHTNLKNQ